MPEYLLSVNHVEGDPTPSGEEMERMFADVGAFNDKVRESGSWVFAGGLMPRETATTVDNTGEEAVVTDGPFAEAKEWLGGFWIIDVPDLDAALRWATEGSKACGEEARSAYDAAIELAENAAEQAWLVRRRDSLA